ncbi:MAG: helix-turn-helix domain-containing protein [Fibrobacterota bacterium]
MSEGYMTVEELAEYLGYSTGTIYNKVYANEIPYHKLSARAVRFKRSEIDGWARTQKRLMHLKKETGDLDLPTLFAKLPLDVVRILHERTDEAVAVLRDRFD